MKRRILLFILLSILPAAASGDGFNTIARTNTLLKKAEKAMKEKNYRLAARSYEDALKENPDLPAQTRLNLGHAYFESGQNRLAQKNYLSSLNGLSQAGQKSGVCLQIGNLFAREKDYKSALDWYRKSLLHQPDNQTARRNYEMAWRLNKKMEEEKKNQEPEQNAKKQDQQNQQQKDQNQNPSKPEQNKSGQDQSGKGSGSKPKDNPGSEGKDRDRDKEASDKNQSGKRGEENQDEEEEKDENGKESRKKTNESDSQDPDAYRMDKKKLKESGLNEEQAKNMLKAMRQNEVKYLQQRQFRGKNSPKSGSGPRW